MAIYHFSAQIISRGSGKSSVASAAYRSGEKLEDERTGMKHDYTKKQGIEHTEILAPSSAPEWATDRNRLWNEVETIEKSKDSQLSREINIALPVELSKDQQIELTRNYVQDNFVSKGMVADIAIHDKGDGNPHAHIMLTMRPFNEDGTWGAKAKKEYILDKDGNKIYDKKGNAKSRKIESTDWNKKETLESWREQWANYANKALELSGCQDRIDHRTLQEQGIDRVAQIHVGVHASAMEKKGISTDRGNLNREIQDINSKLKEINKEKVVALQEYKELKEKLSQVKDPSLLAEKKNIETSMKALEMQLGEWGKHLSLKFKYEKELENLNKNSGMFQNRAEKKELKALIDHEEYCLKSTGFTEGKYDKYQTEYRANNKRLESLNDKLMDNIGISSSKAVGAIASLTKQKNKDEAADTMAKIGGLIISEGIKAANRVIEKDKKEHAAAERIKVVEEKKNGIGEILKVNKTLQEPSNEKNKPKILVDSEKEPQKSFKSFMDGFKALGVDSSDILLFKKLDTKTISLDDILKNTVNSLSKQAALKFVELSKSGYVEVNTSEGMKNAKFTLTNKGSMFMNEYYKKIEPYGEAFVKQREQKAIQEFDKNQSIKPKSKDLGGR